MYRVLYQLGQQTDVDLRPATMWKQITSRLPDDVAQAQGTRVLWRGEGETAVLVQYPVRPHPSWLLPDTTSFPLVMDMRVQLDSLAVGQLWAFDLPATTIRRTKGGEVAVSAEAWLDEATGADGPSRAYQNGFRLVHLSDSPQQRHGAAAMGELTRIRGLLEVEDVEALTTGMLEGIGRGKAQGAGLMSLHQARRKSGRATRRSA